MKNKKGLIFLCIFLLYLIPTFIQPIFIENNKIAGATIGLPTTQTGDEPHYYITLYSLVNDHDFFLTNNYNNAFYQNGSDLGEKQYSEENRHTQLFDSETNTLSSMFVGDSKSVELRYIPEENSTLKEISLHPLGLPFFAFLFLWPFTNTPLLEHLAIYLTLLFSLMGVYYFYKIMKYYHNDEGMSLFYTFLFACATQYWHYSKTFWAEPYLASFLLLTWYFIMVKKGIWKCIIAGFIFGFGFTMKYPFLLAIVPFWCYLLYKKMFKEMIAFSFPVLLCIFGVLFLNYYLTGNPLQFNQIDAVAFANPFIGIVRWLFSPTFGLLIFSPVLIFAGFGIKKFWDNNKEDTIIALSALLLYFCFWTIYIVAQKGSGGYGARYLIPLIAPLVFFVSFAHLESSDSPFLKYSFYILFFLSLIINALAAFAYPAFTGYPLYTSIEKVIGFLL